MDWREHFQRIVSRSKSIPPGSKEYRDDLPQLARERSHQNLMEAKRNVIWDRFMPEADTDPEVAKKAAAAMINETINRWGPEDHEQRHYCELAAQEMLSSWLKIYPNWMTRAEVQKMHNPLG